MSPSRRETLRLAGASAASVVAATAGCVAPGTAGADAGSTANGSETSVNPTLDVRLVGPDGDRRLFDAGDVARVGSVGTTRTGRPSLSVALSDEATAAAVETARDAGLADAPGEFEVVVRRDGEAVGRFGVTPELAEAVASGEWRGEFLLLFAHREDAVDLREALVSGADDA